MIDLKTLIINSEEEFINYYVATLDTHILVTKNRRDLSYYDVVGKIKVGYNGIFFGGEEERDNWVWGMIVDHLVSEGNLIESGETAFGDKLWTLAESPKEEEMEKGAK